MNKTLLKKKNKAVGLTLFDFKTVYEARITKTAWYQYMDRHIDEWVYLRF